MKKEEELPNIFASGEDNDRSLEDIIAEDAKDSAAEDKLIKKQSKKKSGILLGSAGILAVAVTAGIILINPFGGDLNFGNKGNPKVVEDVKKPISEDEDFKYVNTTSEEDFVEEPGKKYPIKLEKWQETPVKKQNPSDLKKSILKSLETTEFYSSSNTLPSEASGYTSDDSKQLLSDGTMNPKYSFWTAESLQSEAGQYIERLINPRFGDWERYQYPGYKANDNFDLELISDMFTERWYEENYKKTGSEYIPVLADWNSDSYGIKDQLLISGARWYGKIESSETKLVYNNETQQYDVSVVAKIKYTAWAKDQSKLEKNGTLTLNLVANTNSQISKNKVLIDNANLKMEE